MSIDVRAMKGLAACLAVCLGLAGCAATPTQPLAEPPEQARGEILVYRESAFAAGGVSLSVGIDGRRFANLSNSELARARVATGSHEVLVQARSAEPTRLQVRVDAGQPVCLRTSANPNAFAKAAVPMVLMATGYNFYLDQVLCPPPAELGQYKAVPVAYE